MERIKHPQKLGDRLSEPDRCGLSFLVLYDGWPDDIERFHRSAAAHLSATWELVVVDNPGDEEGSGRIGCLDRTVHIPLRDPVGYGAGRNLAVSQATGAVLCIIDTSIELTGDLGLSFGPDIGLIGRWGVVAVGDHHFEESDGPDVDGVEGYFMALRRTDLGRIGTFDPKFRFYRNADIDFSFQVRDAGLRTVVDPSLPIVRHEHRLWEHTPDRDALSRKNFGRLRQHWGGRPDLLIRR